MVNTGNSPEQGDRPSQAGAHANLMLPAQHLCMDLIGDRLPLRAAEQRRLRSRLERQCSALLLCEVLDERLTQLSGLSRVHDLAKVKH